MISPFNFQSKIQCRKTVTEIIYALSTPPLSIGSREYKNAKISMKDNITKILLLPQVSFPSEKNAGVPIIKLEISEQSTQSLVNICFELPKGLQIMGMILLPVIFFFGLTAVISYFTAKIEYFLVACIPWFVEIFGVLLVWILFRFSTKQLVREITKRLQ